MVRAARERAEELSDVMLQEPSKAYPERLHVVPLDQALRQQGKAAGGVPGHRANHLIVLATVPMPVQRVGRIDDAVSLAQEPDEGEGVAAGARRSAEIQLVVEQPHREDEVA